MKTSAALRALHESGATVEQMIAYVQAAERSEEADREARKERAREKKRKQRAAAVSPNVPGTSGDNPLVPGTNGDIGGHRGTTHLSPGQTGTSGDIGGQPTCPRDNAGQTGTPPCPPFPSPTPPPKPPYNPPLPSEEDYSGQALPEIAAMSWEDQLAEVHQSIGAKFKTADVNQLNSWLAFYDLGKDVLPVVRRMRVWFAQKNRGTKPSSLVWYDKFIRDEYMRNNGMEAFARDPKQLAKHLGRKMKVAQ